MVPFRLTGECLREERYFEGCCLRLDTALAVHCANESGIVDD